MKPIALSIILIVFAGPLIGQTGHSPTGQMFMNHIYSCRYDSLIALEQITARMESKTKGMGFGGSEGGLIMDGEKSPVRIKSGDTIRFAIKIAMSMVDPSMMIMLCKFEGQKSKRMAILSPQSAKKDKGKNSGNASQFNFNVLKESDDFILIPASRLPPGEYGFLNMMMMNREGTTGMSYTVFAFGVD